MIETTIVENALQTLKHAPSESKELHPVGKRKMAMFAYPSMIKEKVRWKQSNRNSALTNLQIPYAPNFVAYLSLKHEGGPRILARYLNYRSLSSLK